MSTDAARVRDERRGPLVYYAREKQDDYPEKILEYDEAHALSVAGFYLGFATNSMRVATASFPIKSVCLTAGTRGNTQPKRSNNLQIPPFILEWITT